MTSLAILAATLAALAAAYFLYGRFLENTFEINDAEPTPAAQRGDGCDFVAAKNPLILFGHHFSSIAGAGPIIGPVIAALTFGWAGVLAWIIIGSIFLGGVGDFGALAVSIKNGGRSVSDASGELISPRARTFFIIFVIMALILVNAIFALYAARTLAESPRITLTSLGLIPVAVIFGWLVYKKNANASWTTVGALGIFAALVVFSGKFPVRAPLNTWITVMLAYSFFASVLPVNLLLQPRDYLSGFLLYLGVAFGLAGIFLRPETVGMPAVIPENFPKVWPMLFITVACGAISGFHALIASGTTSKQIAKQSHARPIGYGAMLVEAIVAVMALLAVTGGIAADVNRANPIAVFSSGFGRMTSVVTGSHGTAFAALLLNAFILTTLDTSTRITRYLVDELIGKTDKYVVTAAVVIVSGTVAFSGAGEKIWPVFGASNQLVASLALFVASMWLARRKKNHLFVLAPAVFMFATTMAGLIFKTLDFAKTGSWLLAAIPAILIPLAIFVAAETFGAYRRARRT